MELEFSGSKLTITVSSQIAVINLKQQLEDEHALKSEDYYLILNGKPVQNDHFISNGIIYIVPRVLGGKGGFGSMLRAAGTQIKKTTNTESCRDLNGRRLRDVNEEQRLNNWINNQEEREKEAKERKKKKLERLCEMPKHEFKDEEYDKERSGLTEMIEEAVLQGLQVQAKRKTTEAVDVVKSKKPKIWFDEEFDDLSSDDSEEDLPKKDTDPKIDNIAGDKQETNDGSKTSSGDNNEKSDEPVEKG